MAVFWVKFSICSPKKIFFDKKTFVYDDVFFQNLQTLSGYP